MQHERIAARLEAAFRRNFDSGLEVGAAVSVWRGEEEIVSVVGGFRDVGESEPWCPETLVLIWSATKGLAAACAVHALAAADLDLQDSVATIWPEFAQAGKEQVTFAHVLSHGAGLGALDQSGLSMVRYEEVIAAIEKQRPIFPVGLGTGYGPRTFGFIADEIVRRATGGLPLGDYWRRHFAEPMALDLWIGTPSNEHHRIARMIAPRFSPGDGAFAQAMADPNSHTRRAFSSPAGMASVSAMNSAEARSLAFPSLGAIGSARGLAKFYAMLANGGTWRGETFFSSQEMTKIMTRLSQGFDHVLRCDTAFSTGFMLDPLDPDGKKIRNTMGPSLAAFGHPGAGGSLAFADPENGIAFAYVMNQMQAGVLPSERALALVRAIYDDE